MSPEENPWQVHASDLKYDNPWLSITEHQVTSPGGKPGIYGVVHFKNQGVGVAPFEDGCLWLVGQYRFPLDRYCWEIPEGGGPWGEDPLDTAKRELEEETGLQAKRWEQLLEMHVSNSATDEWAVVYLARDLSPGEAAPEHTEDLRVRKVPLEEVFAEVEAGHITDCMTVASVYKLMLLRAQGKI